MRSILDPEPMVETGGSLTTPRLMTAAEVSEVLRVARTRRIPFLKVGRRTLFDPELLREWIASPTVPPRA